MNLFTKQKWSHRCRKQTWLPGGKGEKDKLRDLEWHIHIFYGIEQLTNKPIVQHRELYSILCNDLYRKESKKEWIYVYI